MFNVQQVLLVCLIVLLLSLVALGQNPRFNSVTSYYPGFSQVPFNPPLRKNMALPHYNPQLVLTNWGPYFVYKMPHYSITIGDPNVLVPGSLRSQPAILWQRTSRQGIR